MKQNFPLEQVKTFNPNVYVDISKYIEKKIDIMKIYKSELGSHPFPRSEENIKALATFRGASCGFNYAESLFTKTKNN